MRTLIPFVILLFLSLTVNAQGIINIEEPKTGLKGFDLKGKVKQASYFISTAHGGKSDTLEILEERKTIQFNAEGNITNIIYYDKNGVILSRINYEFVNKRKTVLNYFNSIDTLIGQSIDNYNKNGYIIKSTTRAGFYKTVKYDLNDSRNGKIIELNDYSKEDQLI